MCKEEKVGEKNSVGDDDIKKRNYTKEKASALFMVWRLNPCMILFLRDTFGGSVSNRFPEACGCLCRKSDGHALG